MNTMMKYLLLPFFLTYCLIASAYGAETQTLRAAFDEKRALIDQDCAMQKVVYDIAQSKHETENMPLYEQKRDLSCVCLPRELDRIRTQKSDVELDAPVSVADVAKVVGAAGERCAAISMRTIATTGCRSLVSSDIKHPVASVERYCQCKRAQMDKMSDEDLITLMHAHSEYFQAKMAAIHNKQALPPPPPLIAADDAIEQQCRQ
ncbi:MAG: hypothetical protein JO142_07195 [Burkholderiales bacterium]|nr:hypothetical protein [Burkholderiales bacterium]